MKIPRYFSWLMFAVMAKAAAAPGAPAPAAAPVATPPTAVPAKPPLRVAVDPHAAPMIFKSGERFSGLEAEMARGLGAALDRPVVFVTVGWNNLIPALLDDKADIIMSGMSVTRLREVRVAFCDTFLRMGQVAICRRADLTVYANNANLQNLRVPIGVVEGTVGDVVVGSQFSFALRRGYPTLPEAVQALLLKKVDLVITDYPMAVWQSATNEAGVAVVPAQLTQEEIAWAVRKDDDALRAAANLYLAQLKTSGKLAEIVKKWLPDVGPNAIAVVPGNAGQPPAPGSPAAAPAPAPAAPPAQTR